MRRQAKYRELSSYKLCKECGCAMLRKGQKRTHPDDYRHASGCPLDDPAKQAVLEERKRCYDIVMAARMGEIDSDLRCILNRIQNPATEGDSKC